MGNALKNIDNIVNERKKVIKNKTAERTKDKKERDRLFEADEQQTKKELTSFRNKIFKKLNDQITDEMLLENIKKGKDRVKFFISVKEYDKLNSGLVDFYKDCFYKGTYYGKSLTETEYNNYIKNIPSLHKELHNTKRLLGKTVEKLEKHGFDVRFNDGIRSRIIGREVLDVGDYANKYEKYRESDPYLEIRFPK